MVRALFVGAIQSLITKTKRIRIVFLVGFWVFKAVAHRKCLSCTLLLTAMLVALAVFCCLILTHLFLVLAPLTLLLSHLLTHILGVFFILLPVGILELRVRIRCSLSAAVVSVLKILCSLPRTRTRRPPIARSRGATHARDVGRLSDRCKRIVRISANAARVWLVIRVKDDTSGTGRGWQRPTRCCRRLVVQTVQLVTHTLIFNFVRVGLLFSCLAEPAACSLAALLLLFFLNYSELPLDEIAEPAHMWIRHVVKVELDCSLTVQ
mmetsp:Transcript_122942/g.298482  ORF Transcript_122942/g.298482 Transcript_122942/m.298482 type:complete len:265 (+) Transcript_122942:124-918(+)